VGFRSGTEALDRNFREIVTQDIKQRVTLCYVALTNTRTHELVAGKLRRKLKGQ
jgi:hypothetical protein